MLCKRLKELLNFTCLLDLFMNTLKKLSPFLNKVFQGDCIQKLKSLPRESIDLVFADPPYNLQLKQKLFRPNMTKVNGVEDDWDQFLSFKAYDDFSLAWLKQCQRVLKPNGSLWVIGSYHNIFRVGAALQNLGFWILNDVIWVKSNPMPNFRGARFTNAHETLIWAGRSEKSKVTFNYKTMKAFNCDKQMRSDWLLPICSGKERLKDQSGRKLHSTQKPEGLLKRVILASTKEGDVVLDPFFGTGTTGAAAKKLNRNFIGFEKEKKYVLKARKRIQSVKAYHKKLTFQREELPKPKVSFGLLVESGYIQPGEMVYSKDKKHSAAVMADGTLKNGRYFGSIHKVSAQLLKKENHNGWMFWNLIHKNQLISIDHLRRLFFKKNNT